MRQKQNNLLIIGPLPEPKGGVSIHITRLSELMRDSFNIRFIDESPIRKPDVFNIRSLNIPAYLRLLAWSDIVHIHSGVSLLRTIHILAATLFLKNVIVTIHSFPHQRGLQSTITSWTLKFADKIIVVNDEIPGKLRLRKFLVKPAFIPPKPDIEPELPENISNWINTRKKSKDRILSANAFRIVFHNGIDLYGIDLCISMLDELVNHQKQNVSLIFVVASLANTQEHFEHYKKLIKEQGLADHMLLVHADLSFVKLIERSDVVLRPTCSDGDALTIREALFLGKPVIASDVVRRPAGTTLFINRNHQNMALKVIEIQNASRSTSLQTETLSAYKKYYCELYLD